MDDEDDYDDFGDELENDLASDGEAGGETVAGPGLPTAAPTGVQDEELQPDPTSEIKDGRTPAEPTFRAWQGRDGGQDAERMQDDHVPEELDLEEEKAMQRQQIFSQMTEDQLNRFEAYRRSSLSKAGMRKLLQAVTGQNPSSAASKNAIILLCGVAKMMVGELIEEARVIAAEQGESGPLRPKHIDAAFQRVDPIRIFLGDRRKRLL